MEVVERKRNAETSIRSERGNRERQIKGGGRRVGESAIHFGSKRKIYPLGPGTTATKKEKILNRGKKGRKKLQKRKGGGANGAISRP